jgi:hypothetical protein
MVHSYTDHATNSQAPLLILAWKPAVLASWWSSISQWLSYVAIGSQVLNVCGRHVAVEIYSHQYRPTIIIKKKAHDLVRVQEFLVRFKWSNRRRSTSQCASMVRLWKGNYGTKKRRNTWFFDVFHLIAFLKSSPHKRFASENTWWNLGQMSNLGLYLIVRLIIYLADNLIIF